MAKFPPSLHPSIIKKLKMLSVVTMAASNKHLDYSQLMERLDLGDVRELEDLLIECIYAGIVVGRLDQQSSQLKIERVSGRDPSDLDIVNMCQKLDQWGLTVDNMILQVETTSKQAANEYDVAKMKKTALKGRWGGGLFVVVVRGWPRRSHFFVPFVRWVRIPICCVCRASECIEREKTETNVGVQQKQRFVVLLLFFFHGRWLDRWKWNDGGWDGRWDGGGTAGQSR